LLLLDGGPGFDHSGFKPDMAQLADIAQVVYLDHRGSGRSDRGSVDRWKLDQWADDIRLFCDTLDIRQPIVMGQSFGGCVAMAYAIRHPDHPSKLIVSSALVRPIGGRSFAIFERLGGAVAREAAIAFWTNPGPDTRKDYFTHCMPLYTRRAMPPEFFSRSVRNPDVADSFFGGELKTLDLLPHLSRIKCSTLVTGGEELDIAARIREAQRAMKAVERRVKASGEEFGHSIEILSAGQHKSRRAKKELTEANLRLVVSLVRDTLPNQVVRVGPGKALPTHH